MMVRTALKLDMITSCYSLATHQAESCIPAGHKLKQNIKVELRHARRANVLHKFKCTPLMEGVRTK